MTLEEKFLKNKSKFKDGFTTTGELNKLEFENYEISRLCEKGYLVRIRQGIYKVKYPTTIQWIKIGERIVKSTHCAPPINKQKLIAKVIPEAVFCYNYAWCLCWGKERFPKTIHIAVPRNISRSKCKAIEGMDLVIHYLPEDLHSQDVIYGEVPYYNTERTICDLFKYHRFKSERWLSDTTREYVKKSLDTDKLNRLIVCAEKLCLDKESKDLMERFLWKRAEKTDDMFKFKRKIAKLHSASKKSSVKKSNKKNRTIPQKAMKRSPEKVDKSVILAGSLYDFEIETIEPNFWKLSDKEKTYKHKERFDEMYDEESPYYSDEDNYYDNEGHMFFDDYE